MGAGPVVVGMAAVSAEYALSEWYRKRFGCGNAQARKVGIVALARKLLIALWKYVEKGEVPPGAEVVPWKEKLNNRLVVS